MSKKEKTLLVIILCFILLVTSIGFLKVYGIAERYQNEVTIVV